MQSILDPSRAIAPEYYVYTLETDDGLLHAGFLAEKNDKEIVLKDAKGQLIRVPATTVGAYTKNEESMMPTLVLRDVTAQDAADLLAYLVGLRGDLQFVSSFQILGPFDSTDGDLETTLEAEKDLKEPDLTAEYDSDGIDGTTNRWETIASDGSLGFPGVDTVAYDAHTRFSEKVTHYFAVVADSPFSSRLSWC